MEKIANIVYYEPLVNHTKVDYINYLENLSDDDKLPQVPTLYVGWKEVKEDFKKTGADLSILEKEIRKGLVHWEFSFAENKAQHISGVNMFTINAPTYFFNSFYEYKLIDPVKDNIYHIEDLLNRIPDDCESIFNYKDQMVYLLKGRIVYGIDLNMYDFFNLTPILPKLEAKAKVSYADDNGDLFAKYNQIFKGYNNLKRYLVVLLSK